MLALASKSHGVLLPEEDSPLNGKASLHGSLLLGEWRGIQRDWLTYRDISLDLVSTHALKYSLTGLKLGGESYDPFDASGS